MSFLNITTLLDAIQTRIIDNSTVTRSKLLAWTNEAMRSVVLDRDWEFLKTSVSVTPANNQIDMTAYTDYDRIFSFRNDHFCLYAHDRISDEQITIESANADSGVPSYFKEASQVFTFYPGITADSVTATYIKTFTDYVDNSATTIFPTECRNALIRTVLAIYYEFDADERFMAANTIAQNEIRLLRDWDNRLKPQIKYNPVIGGRNYYNG